MFNHPISIFILFGSVFILIIYIINPNGFHSPVQQIESHEYIHEKTVIRTDIYAIRLLCIDNKEFIFLNSNGSTIVENKNESGVQKFCNY